MSNVILLTLQVNLVAKTSLKAKLLDKCSVSLSVIIGPMFPDTEIEADSKTGLLAKNQY